MPHHQSLSTTQTDENSVFNNQYLTSLSLNNLAEIQSQQTQNALGDLAVSGENELNTIAGA